MSDHLRLNDLVLVTLDLFALSEVLLDAGESQHAVRFVGAAQVLSDRLDMAGERALFVSIAEVQKRVAALRGRPGSRPSGQQAPPGMLRMRQRRRTSSPKRWTLPANPVDLTHLFRNRSHHESLRSHACSPRGTATGRSPKRSLSPPAPSAPTSITSSRNWICGRGYRSQTGSRRRKGLSAIKAEQPNPVLPADLQPN